MSQAIYRKYRPQRFEEVVGQDHVTHTLQNEIASGKLVHAYLFCGIRGIGKTTMARLLAKALNCEKIKPGVSEPCGLCTSCKAVSGNTSLDLIEIDAASNRRIDDIREIKQHIPYGPITSNYKVVIIDEVHMLTAEAFNALLKTLEEPPAHTIFVLATTEVHKLPETIISRCQRFDFHKVSVKDLVPRLKKITKNEGIKVDDEVLNEVARLSGGSSRDAESLLGKLLSLGEKTITVEQASLVLPRSDIKIAIELVNAMVERNTAEAIGKVNDFYFEGGDLWYLHQQVTELVRKLLLIKLGGGLHKLSSMDLAPAQETQLTDLAKQVTHLRVQEMLDLWLKASIVNQTNDIAQLPIEMSLVSICEAKSFNNQFDVKPKNNKTTAINEGAQNQPVKPKSITGTGVMQLETIKSNWPALIERLKDYNHSLSFILSVAEPVKIEGNKVEVAFEYSLHLERVNNSKVREVIEKALHDIIGIPLVFKAVVKKTKQAVGGDLLNNVLSTFGGRVE